MVKDYSKLADSVLMQECSLDNMLAFNQLFDRYFEPLYRFATTYVKNTDAAEELVMDLMHNIWKKRAQLVIRGEVKIYLFSALKNIVFNHIRKRELQTVAIHTIPEITNFAHTSLEEAIDGKELEKIYQLKLEKLSPQRKKIFKLSREENMTYPQIAEQMNLSINTIKTQMVVSLKYLREQMKEHVDISICLVLYHFL